MRPSLKERRKAQVLRYRDSERVYRLIDRREASRITGKARRRDDASTNYGAF